ncbi:MAG TPA: NAD-dependent epimerase/dehydratase family protein [Candidatus Angelobacter sp.]|nr:NAD-dependent epimerase/dehydratase family protein [Candidatus Angelobacter sp.]
MNILVTGGAGFIGSHLAERHLGVRHRVTVIDDLSTGSFANIEHLKSRPGFNYRIDTITNQPLMSELVDSSDVVYHLAAVVGVRLVIENPRRTMETNIRGTEVVLELAAKKQKRVLVTSTSEVYGTQDRIPFREDESLVLGPTHKSRWSYAYSKAIDECLAIAYWKQERVRTVIARLFNTVGPRQTGRYGMVIPTLVRQALTGEDMTVFGDGGQSRCFTHVSDAVRALIGMAAHPEANGEVYNVGSDHETTILELANSIKKLTGSSSRIVFVPYDRAYGSDFEDTRRRVPDLSKLNGLIGYEPQFSLEQTLLDIIHDQKIRLRKPGIKTHHAPGLGIDRYSA